MFELNLKLSIMNMEDMSFYQDTFYQDLCSMIPAYIILMAVIILCYVAKNIYCLIKGYYFQYWDYPLVLVSGTIGFVSSIAIVKYIVMPITWPIFLYFYELGPILC